MNDPEEIRTQLRRAEAANEAKAYLMGELERMRREAVGLLAQIESFERAIAALEREPSPEPTKEKP